MVPTPPEGLVVITGSLALFVYAERPVKLEALIAGKAPDNFDAVNVEILASATVPVKLPAGIAVRLAPLIAGKVPDKLPAVKFVKLLALRAGKAPVSLLDDIASIIESVIFQVAIYSFLFFFFVNINYLILTTCWMISCRCHISYIRRITVCCKTKFLNYI